MVGAAVAATVDSTRLVGVNGIGFARHDEEPTFDAVTSLVAESVASLPEPPAGPIVAERGEFYEEPRVRVESHLGHEFKYVESIAERETVAAAHHAAYAARKLLV